MNKIILSLIKNLSNVDINCLSILTILMIVFGVSQTENAQASSFNLSQQGFPNDGKITGFFSGKDDNNDGFLSENEVGIWSFEYISGENVANFRIDSSFSPNLLSFSYDLSSNELNSVNVQEFLEDGEFGYFYNKDGLSSFGNPLGLVFLNAPSPNQQDISFESAAVTPVNEYSSIPSLLILGALGTGLVLKQKL